MRLSDVCDIQVGYTARSRFEALERGGVPVIQLRDLSGSGIADPSTLTRVQFIKRSERYSVSAGDVLFRSRGEVTVAVALDLRFQEPAIAVLPLLILRPLPAVVLPQYLAWVINQPAAQRQLDATAQGTGLRMVPKSTLDALDIDVPDLAIQKRVVAIADLATQEEALLHHLAAKKVSLINQLLALRAAGKSSFSQQ